ncbi:MAG: fused MFS/spermidine synthase [Rhodocyclales bacterium]|nr:fused MFS/spermidine synthase [Rhodocyclales bacterium]
MTDDSPDHSIDISEEDGVRYLHFGSEWIQGAMRIRRPWALELDYTREMMAGLLLRAAPWPKSALLIGLGAGSLAKFIWRHLPQTKATVVEINPRMPFAARQFFKLPDEDERLQIRIGDGAELIARDRRRYDLILVDGFDHNARVGALDSLPFYQHCRERLSKEGLFATNLFGDRRGFRASVERVREGFAGRALVLPACAGGNSIALAAAGEPLAVPLAELRLRAATVKRETGLDLKPTLSRMQLAAAMPDGVLQL